MAARLYNVSLERDKELDRLKAAVDGTEILLDKLRSENEQLKEENRRLKMRVAELGG